MYNYVIKHTVHGSHPRPRCPLGNLYFIRSHTSKSVAIAPKMALSVTQLSG